MAILTGGARFAIDMNNLGFVPLNGGVVDFAVTSMLYADSAPGSRDTLYGNFSYDGFGLVAGGVITHVQEDLLGFPHFDLSGFSMSAVAFIQGAGSVAVLQTILSGDDQISGSPLNDNLFGAAGNDTINGLGGFDTIFGGDGDDVITSGALSGFGQTLLRGDAGNDSISGGINFDDINGNQGNDTIDGGAGGSDWLVGGQGNDSITAHHSQNILYGNLGDDTLHGGDGGDLIRGGQGDDSISGGAANDFISGDRGNDTESGGRGADIFHSSSDAGVDKVTDFNFAEGDRVQLDPGTVYTVAQSGSDVVITMSAGGELVLAGVSLSSLTGDWISGGTNADAPPVPTGVANSAGVSVTLGTAQGVDMGQLDLNNLLLGTITQASSSEIVVDYGGGDSDRFFGSFSYDSAGNLVGGVLNEVTEVLGGALNFRAVGLAVPATTFVDWVEAGATSTALTTILNGNDTFIGSPFADVLFSFGGNDTLSGGGGDDSLNGGAGNDLISGDAGNDILAGGSGADVFHASTGRDLVLDFHISEGDRVQLDHGATFTLSQVGADTVIDLGGGNQMILAGVQLSTLTPGWIFGS